MKEGSPSFVRGRTGHGKSAVLLPPCRTGVCPKKLDVLLARGCGETQIELCPGVYGKELFHGIKQLDIMPMLQLTRWLANEPPGSCHCGALVGGEEHYTLLAVAWTPPTDHRLEQRSKVPIAFFTWLRYAENAVKVFGSAYGLEHVPERLPFVSFLRKANEENKNAYPVTHCIRLYEEFNAVWREAIRESRRLCAKPGTENPRLEDFKLIVFAPSDDVTPNFQFPREWDLKDAEREKEKWVTHWL